MTAHTLFTLWIALILINRFYRNEVYLRKGDNIMRLLCKTGEKNKQFYFCIAFLIYHFLWSDRYTITEILRIYWLPIMPFFLCFWMIAYRYKYTCLFSIFSRDLMILLTHFIFKFSKPNEFIVKSLSENTLSFKWFRVCQKNQSSLWVIFSDNYLVILLLFSSYMDVIPIRFCQVG
jgi:hypothetical protein